CNLDEGHLWCVSLKRRDDLGALRADDDGAAQSRRVCCNELCDLNPLEQTPDDPDHIVKRTQRCVGGMRGRRCGVSDPLDLTSSREPLHAMGVQLEIKRRGCNLFRRDTTRASEC